MSGRKDGPNLLIVDDDDVVGGLLEMQAADRGFRPLVMEDGEDAMNRLPGLREELEVVLLDLMMPGWSGIQCLEFLSQHFPEIPVVVLSSAHEIELAVKAMRLGAFDYLTKPFDPEELFAVIRNAKRLRKAEQENVSLRAALESGGAGSGLVACSEGMREVVEQARKVAPLDATVLLTGESGVGKGVLARMIHAESARANAPMLTVSCPALPRELLESELFGHEKGAFTGANRRRIGKIEAAAGGTLFLDEIGDLGIDLQPKLLNVTARKLLLTARKLLLAVGY